MQTRIDDQGAYEEIKKRFDIMNKKRAVRVN